jgi:hypothetical protein
MSNATRYLCAAAYLEPSFPDAVIGELLFSHRAVAPSRGIDLEPVLRHCLKVRQLQLVRDTLLCGLLVIGVLFALIPLIAIGITAFLLALLPLGDAQQRLRGSHRRGGALKVGMWIVVAAIVALIAFSYLGSWMRGADLLVSRASEVNDFTSRASQALAVGMTGQSSPLKVLWWLVYAGLIAATLLRYSYVRNLTLSEWLSPGALAPEFARESPEVEGRIGEVCAAQHGNLLLYSGEDPFLGSGVVQPGWSIAIELSREGVPRGLVQAEARSQVSIDAVELHDLLRERLLRLNDPDLPPGQRVAALSIDHQVIGEGRFRWDSPLFDEDLMLPYSQAGEETITALIRNPQAELRCFQRVSISDEGFAVQAGGHPVVGPVDQEVIVSAFVYVAVEGHMFYLQFMPTVLAPILDRYRLIDRMPKTDSAKFLIAVIADTAKSAFADLLRAPIGVVAAWRQSREEARSFAEELSDAGDYAYANLGARISVREMVGGLRPRTYIQRFDAAKYVRVIERLVTETALDFLQAKEVDTSAFRASVQAIYNSGIIVAGSGNAVASNTGDGSAAATNTAQTAGANR